MRALRIDAARYARSLFRRSCLGNNERAHLHQIRANPDCPATCFLAPPLGPCAGRASKQDERRDEIGAALHAAPQLADAGLLRTTHPAAAGLCSAFSKRSGSTYWHIACICASDLRNCSSHVWRCAPALAHICAGSMPDIARIFRHCSLSLSTAMAALPGLHGPSYE